MEIFSESFVTNKYFDFYEANDTTIFSPFLMSSIISYGYESSSRDIYKFEHNSETYLLKVDVEEILHEYGEYGSQGQMEVLKYYNFIKKQDRKYFVEPIDCGFLSNGNFWIVEKFLKVVKPKKPYPIIMDMAYKYQVDDITFNPEYAFNWGVLEETGQPIIFDYAR